MLDQLAAHGLTAFHFITAPLVLLLAYVLDLLLGDPQSWPHPVKAIGSLIASLDRLLNRPYRNKARSLVLGAIPGFFLPLLLAVLFYALCRILFRLNPALNLVLRLLFCYQLLALQDMRKELAGISRALRTEGLGAARRQVGRIVGRETQSLDAEEVCKAAIESAAENFSDGFVAPLFYFVLGDLPLMILYKTVNTLDSMIAYKNERYLYFGRVAARFDDLLNWVPARLSALLLLLTAWPLRLDARAAWRIYRRDRKAHSSPNAGQCEAVAAGALGLQLGGDHVYHGVLMPKPTIGDDTRPADIADIERMRNWLFLAGTTTVILGMALIMAWRTLWI